MFKKVFSFIYIFLCFTVAICNCNAANEVFHGFECNQDRDGKEYLFTDTDLPGRPINNPAIIYRCIFNQSNNSGSWSMSPNSFLQFCFDDDESNPVHTNPQNFKVGKSISDIRAYVNPTIEPVPGTTFVYEYTNNKDDMCTWCLPNKYGYHFTENSEEHIECFDKEEETLCEYANHKYRQNTEWKNNKCKCPESNQTWNKERRICEEEKYGLKCSAAIDGEKYVFLDDGPSLYLCSFGKWAYMLNGHNWCFAPEDFDDVTQTPPDILEYKVGDSGYGLYINKNYQPIANKIYKYSDDINNICMWCIQPAAYPYINSDGDIDCRNYSSENEAWCDFAKYKNGESVKWEDNQCICIDADGNADTSKEWDTENHTCKNTNSNGTTPETKYDFECTPERYGKKYVFVQEASAYTCSSSGTWDHQDGDDVTECQNILDAEEGVTKYTAPTNFMHKSSGLGFAFYVKNGITTVADGVYEFNPDNTVMCMGCYDGYFLKKITENEPLCYSSEQEAWCRFAKEKNSANVEWDNENNKCKCIGDDAGKEWDTTEHKCKPSSETQEESEDNNQQTCAEQFAGDEAAIACCQKSELNPAETTFDKTTKACSCTDTTKEWDVDEKMCKDKEHVITEKDFTTAKKTVDNFFKKADENASVWKDASGKFNTVRLASDLTAGVVLGTVGGVVSGVVIKKKQIEKGFEVLHCAVGGQSVADWGDTFTVGLKK